MNKENSVKVTTIICIESIEPIKPLEYKGIGICLHNRQSEFNEAFRRGFSSDLEISDGWETDSFFVKNRTTEKEYKVEFETVNNKTHASCECPDFLHRKRICKHISFALVETFYKTVLV